MATEYYYFVTGLPAQSPEDTKLLMTPLMFLHEAKDHLDKVDYELLELLLVPNDITNLVGILLNKDQWSDENTVDREEWLTLIEHIKELSDLSNLKKKHLDDHILPLIIEYLGIYLKQDTPKPEYTLYKELFTLFYDWAENHPNQFVQDWFRFDAAIRNVVIALNCRKHNMSVQDQLIGTNELTEKLLKSNAADYGLGSDYPWFELVSRLTEQPDIVDKEKGYDALRWKWLDDRTFFDYFTIPRIMAYFIRLRIVYRWIHLSQAVGEKRFGQILHDLETSFEFPEEFALNKR
jgi:hypothetical protein